MENVKSIYNKIIKLLSYISIVFVLIMMVYITLDVLVRNFSKTSLVGTYEIVQYYIMPISVFLSIPYAYSSGVMPKLVLMVNKIPKVRIRENMQLLCNAIGFLIYLTLTYYSLRYAIQSTLDGYAVIVGSSLVPAYHIYYLIPLAFALMSVEDLIQMSDLLRNRDIMEEKIL